LGGPSERSGVQPVGRPVVARPDDPGRGEAVQVLADPRDREAESLREVASGRLRPSERPGDLQTLGIRKGAQDVVGRFGHVGIHDYHAPMELTDPQRRTYEHLIGTGPRPSFPSDLPQRLRDRIEKGLAGFQLSEPLWLGKEKLTDHA